MRLRAILKLAVLCAFLLSAFNFCPPGARPARSQAMDCCRQAAQRHGPAKQAKKISCCTQERLAASPAKLIEVASALPLYTLTVRIDAPRIVAHRLARTLIRPAGPPGPVVLASAGNRAPPLA